MMRVPCAHAVAIGLQFTNDGDGLDDIVNLYPDVYYALRGSTGDFIGTGKASPTVWGVHPYYAFPAAYDFGGKAKILFGASEYGLGLLNRPISNRNYYRRVNQRLRVNHPLSGWQTSVYPQSSRTLPSHHSSSNIPHYQ